MIPTDRPTCQLRNGPLDTWPFPCSVPVPLRPLPVDREQVPRPALRRLDGGLRGGHGARPPARPDGGGAHQRRARHLGVLPAPQAEGGQASNIPIPEAKCNFFTGFCDAD